MPHGFSIYVSRQDGTSGQVAVVMSGFHREVQSRALLGIFGALRRILRGVASSNCPGGPRTIITYSHWGMVYTTYKDGDVGGWFMMVYDGL